ncbi:hypothetical protein J4558_07760 [Leptolyngbya sp. 15MV]|nr:hypothetical protein J4558_07760 [Leptolyngbya sp. 15MV]
MSLITIIATGFLVQAPADTVDVAYPELSQGRNEAAIARIERNDSLRTDDPARLINLGIAHAREGREGEARALFRTAVRSEESVRLETATGAWRDSRDLARMALQMLDRGEFSPARQMASR